MDLKKDIDIFIKVCKAKKLGLGSNKRSLGFCNYETSLIFLFKENRTFSYAFFAFSCFMCFLEVSTLNIDRFFSQGFLSHKVNFLQKRLKDIEKLNQVKRKFVPLMSEKELWT